LLLEVLEHLHEAVGAVIPAPGVAGEVVARREAAVARLVVERGQGDLLEVIGALGATGRLAGRLHRRQQQRDQHRDDGHHDEELDQRKAGPDPTMDVTIDHGKPSQGINLPSEFWADVHQSTPTTAAAWERSTSNQYFAEALPEGASLRDSPLGCER